MNLLHGVRNYEFMYEFHISKKVREKYDFNDSLFSFNGNVIFANFYSVREFTMKLNEKREIKDKVKPGQVNAMGLLDEIFHLLLRKYETEVNPDVFKRALFYLYDNLTEQNVNETLKRFIDEFPPNEVYKNKISVDDYLMKETSGISNKAISIEELMLLYIANFNPANKKFKELFEEDKLKKSSSYDEIIKLLEIFFKNEKKFGPDDQHIFDLLKTPIVNHPESLEDQLKFIKEKWQKIVDVDLIDKILSSMDLIKEDTLFDFTGGGATAIVPKYKAGLTDADFLTLGKSGYNYGADSYLEYTEPENFTPDIHWMPRVVLMAKNVYVWLDQLSKKYQREIRTLDQIPDEELDALARWNFTGLWLIGLWERSKASKRIKQINGNLDAVASAYSLYDYVIAAEIGGEDAFNNLDYRCKQRSIRLASDMVPNHMGIDSKWVVENPDYFIQNNYSPFPNYTFTGEDLSENPDIEIKIEDGYFRKSDAAVVFRRVDKRSGDTRYIYHGNDGTNMPWNDTAQLNMLKQEVREAVIQTIFHVARKTSIIRFDAAMTLAKKHFHRLWYPQPGTGGDIPSRSDHALTRQKFDEFFPKEFWREVVDRINYEMPETLLLAEAFWLMEGYFVRTLGMHRVYNSAFMHMMMKEENEKYRDLITNTLEFNPEILKRYVNFMSNPDEETAIKQFGTDDKYFGVVVLMITLPGLPMFGHGQVEGYTEKYGMEYKRAYYNEQPNQWLVERHEKEIFPLMKKRYMFSQVDDFWLYDFYDTHGNINENVFVYTNRYKDERALVVYNNKYDSTAGWIKYSTGKVINNDKQIQNISLGEALSIKNDNDHFYIFRDHISNLSYIRTGREIYESGIFIELDGFEYHVFTDFIEVYDVSGNYHKLYNKLNGAGIFDVEREIVTLKFDSVHQALSNLFESKNMELLKNAYLSEDESSDIQKNLKYILNKYSIFLEKVSESINQTENYSEIENKFKKGLSAIKNLNHILHDKNLHLERDVIEEQFKKSFLLNEEGNYTQNLIIYLLWLSIENLGMLENIENYDEKSIEIFNELWLDIPAKNVLKRLGKSDNFIYEQILMIKILIKYYLFDIGEKHFEEEITISVDVEESENTVSDEDIVTLTEHEKLLVEKLLNDDEVRRFIRVNEHEGVLYYSKENLDELISWLLALKVLNYLSGKDMEELENIKLMDYMNNAYLASKRIKDISEQSEYKLKQLLLNINSI